MWRTRCAAPCGGAEPRCDPMAAPRARGSPIQAGGIEALVWLMRTSRLADGACDPAAWALAHLAANNDNRKAILQAGAIEPLVALVRGGSAVAQENAAAALRYLAEGPDNEAISALRSLALNSNSREVIAQVKMMASSVSCSYCVIPGKVMVY